MRRSGPLRRCESSPVKSRRPRPEWDDTIHNLQALKLSREEQEQKKSQFQSHNHASLVAQRQLEAEDLLYQDTPWAGTGTSPPSLDGQSRGGAPLSEGPVPFVRRVALPATTRRLPAKSTIKRSGSTDSFSCWSEDSTALSEDIRLDFSDEDSASEGGGRKSRAPSNRQGTTRADGEQGDLDARLERALTALKECKEDVTELRNGHKQLQMELTEFMRNAASAFAHLQAQVLELGIHQQGP